MQLANRSKSSSIGTLAASIALALSGWGCDVAQDETEDAVSGEAMALLGPGDPLFEISLSPPSQTMGQNEFTTFNVSVDPLEGFTGDVTLNVSSDPSFLGSFFLSSEVLTPPDSTTLFVGSFCETTPGDYTLTVTGTDAGGTAASTDALLTVEDTEFPPFAGISLFREGFTVNFFDSSSPGGCDFSEEIVEWAWDFGDGATSTEENPTHTYAARGDYTVTLTVTNDEGLSDSTSATITVLPPPPILWIHRITRDMPNFEFRVDLRWTGAEGERVSLQRNNFEVDLPINDGAHRDRFRSSQTSFSWAICEVGIFFCSNTVSVDLGPDDFATVTTEIGGETTVESIAIEDAAYAGDDM